MMRFVKTTVASAAVLFSLGAIASEEWVKTQLVSAHQVETGAETSAVLTNLSPAAIQKGLRDTQLIADVAHDKKSGLVSYTWHSLAKEINGTEYAQALSEPLISQVKVSKEVTNVSAGQELVAKGDVESMLADFDLLLAKAKEPTEVDASSTLNQETVNEADNGAAGSSGGSGYLSGNEGVTENPDVNDPTLELDKIVEKAESCSMKIDLTNMIVSQQERVIKTSSKTGEVVETTECQNVGQAYPIRKDFQAGCSVNLDKTSGQYVKGFKLYSMVDGKRYDISECEWENSDGISYDVFKDFEACPLNKSVINADRGIYRPAFVEYTTIDGKRYDLGDCITSESQEKSLPTKLEMCTNYHDLVAKVSYERQRTDTYDPEFKSVLKSTECSNTGTSYPIERDYELSECADLPDYNQGKLFLGYKNYYVKSSENEYIGNCISDMDKPQTITQEIGECIAVENLTDKLATLKKRWFYTDESTGKKVFVSDCVESDETYPIVTTEETCNPEYLADINKVIIKSRDGWKDSNNGWHFVSECRPSGAEADIQTEVCSAPKYEHDFVGSQSYIRSRDYYVYKNDKQYLNECSRDTKLSFSHFKETAGCGVQHDDGNLRSRIFTKTMANLQEGKTELKGCEAENQYVPYQYVSGFSKYDSPAVSYWRDIRSICLDSRVDESKNIVSTYGTGMTYLPHAGAIGADFGSSGSMSKAWIDINVKDWRRMDGTIYRQYVTYTCSNQP